MSILASRYKDIRALAQSHPAFKAAVRRGVPRDDLLQEVLLFIHSRQEGRSAYDPNRGSLSKYVWVCTGSAVSNYVRAHKHDVHGVDDPIDDCALVDSERFDAQAPEPLDMDAEVRALADDMGLDETDRTILRGLIRGERRGDIRRALRLPRRARRNVDDRSPVVDRVQDLLERIAAHTGRPLVAHGYGSSVRTHVMDFVGTSGVGLTADTLKRAIEHGGKGGSLFLAPQAIEQVFQVAWSEPLAPGLSWCGCLFDSNLYSVEACEVINGGHDYQGWYVTPSGQRIAVISKAA